MPPPRPPDDRSDRRLEELLERYGRLLSATLRRVCPRDLGIDTQDLEQEARVRLWRTLSRTGTGDRSADATESTPNPSYIYKVATSVAIDAIRAATARRDRLALPGGGGSSAGSGADDAPGLEAREPAEPPGRSPEDRARRRQVASAIEAGLAQLPAARQRAVRLHLWGLSSPEISRRTGWSETKTRSLISRGLAELRRRLTERGVDRDAGS